MEYFVLFALIGLYIWSSFSSNKHSEKFNQKKNNEPNSKLNHSQTNEKFEVFFLNNIKVKFYPHKHIYFVEDQEVLSITQLIKHNKIFGLKDRYVMIPKTILKNASEKGTNLIKEIHEFESRGILGSSNEFKNYLIIKEKLGFKILELRKMVLLSNQNNEILSAGRIDFIIELNSQKNILLIKRTYELDLDGLSTQANLYSLGYEQTYNEEISKIYCIWLRNDKVDYYEIDKNPSKYLNIVNRI
jgi:hypothetical protein